VPPSPIFNPPAQCESTKFTIRQLYEHLTFANRPAQRVHEMPSVWQSLTEREKQLAAKKPLVVPPHLLSKAATLAARQDIDPATLELIGKAIWQIIIDNKPQSSANLVQNAVLPAGTTWSDLEGFVAYRWPNFAWTQENLYGVKVVEFDWEWDWQCKGSYNGIGAYLQNAGAFEKDLYVAWGYTVNVGMSVLNPANIGSKANPIAGAQMSLSMDVSTLVNKLTSTCKVELNGDCSSALFACDGYIS